MTKRVTMISSLPPIVGLSPYTKGLVLELSKLININFLGFNHIYPKFLYPGKLTDESAEPVGESPSLSIRNVLNWYNPIGWIIEAYKINTEIIHAQWWSFPLAAVYITILGINKLRGKKIILTIHNVKPHERNYLKSFLNRSVFHLGDEFIVHTKNNKEELGKIIKNKKIHIIPHGIIATPKKNLSKNEARRILNIINEDKILLCFGHIRDYKGLDVALEALAAIDDPKVKLMIAGQCWEDWKKYEEIIDKYNLHDRCIKKIGFISVENIEPIFVASDIILLPYKHFEAQSGVGALVLSYDKPLIVSKTGGLPEYVSDQQSLFDISDHKKLAENIKNILSDNDLYQKLLNDQRKKRNDLGWVNIAHKTINLY